MAAVEALAEAMAPTGGYFSALGGKFHKPPGIAVATTGGRIVAGVSIGRILVLRPNGTLDRTLGLSGGCGAAGPQFAVAPGGRIAAIDGNRIPVFDPDDTPVLAVGSHGRGPQGPLQDPRGVDFAPDGRIVAADYGTGRVQASRPGGTADRAFGSYGAGPCQPGRPSDVAAAADGRMAVVDSGNYRAQVFCPSGTLALALGPYGPPTGGSANRAAACTTTPPPAAMRAWPSTCRGLRLALPPAAAQAARRWTAGPSTGEGAGRRIRADCRRGRGGSGAGARGR